MRRLRGCLKVIVNHNVEEIVPVVTKYKDKDGNWVQVTVT